MATRGHAADLPLRPELTDRSDLTLEELVTEARRLLEALVPAQTRYGVNEIPDARTIRYYVSQELLPRPLGYAGGRARYGATHLLRLVMIKKLQSEHATLRQIRAKLAAADDATLRAWLWGTATEALVSAVGTSAGRGAASEAGTLDDHGDRGIAAASAVSGAEAVTSISFTRLALPGGGSVDLPASRLADAASRAAVARDLHLIIRRLGDAHLLDTKETP